MKAEQMFRWGGSAVSWRINACAATLLSIITLFTVTSRGDARDGTGSSMACARGYVPCLPVVDDLDCGEISNAKRPVRIIGTDPYQLDQDRDGMGCIVPGSGGGKKSRYGVILQRPPGREAVTVRAGHLLKVVGWSPTSMAGVRFQLCVVRADGQVCEDSNRYLLEGVAPEVFGSWRVAQGDGRHGVFRLSVKLRGSFVTSDTAALR